MNTAKTCQTWINAVILACALSGCATYEKCGLEGCPGDAKITANVEKALAQHPDVGAPNEITVKTLNHVVFLTGSVSEGLMSETAQSIASHVKGVTYVENSIYVSR
jgi:osmotically-inducible protein OsmY